ncbi:Protein artichoke [Candida viswanathii]|uniref:Protein artichoke n=1 Tax=Candida viswanathii TaxID=5486 RepID=A0A367YP09_9ASCO|nr:Protein artichoke [Candida viswanathii]
MEMRSLSLRGRATVPIENFDKNRFAKLAQLSLNQELTYSDLSILPRQLEKLTCVLEHPDPGTTKLLLPESLEALSMKVVIVTNPESVLNISHLSSLRNVDLVEKSTTRPINHVCKFPPSVRCLTMRYPAVVAADLAAMCPEIVEWNLNGKTHIYEQSFVSSLNFPATVKRMRLTTKLVTSAEKGSDMTTLQSLWERRAPMKIPESVTELHVEETLDKEILLDLNINPFPNLRVLCVDHPLGAHILGSLPSTLTKLSLPPRTFVLDDLRNLVNLDELTITSAKVDADLLAILPLSLRKLELSLCGLEKVHIKAPNLVSLNLSKNPSNVLDSGSFIIPDSVRELDISYCHISRISLRFPANLEVLNLSMNRIASINNLPVGLKRLDCSCNFLGSHDKVSSFPNGLQHLDLGKNCLKTLREVNLSNCRFLRSLNLNKNNISCIEPKYFPHSLKKLHLYENWVSWFADDFRDFPNLEEVDLRYNSAARFFYENRWCGSSLFGENIKRVYLAGNNLTDATMQTLFQLFSQGANFDLFDTMKNAPVPDHPEMERRTKVRRLNAFDTNWIRP